MPSDIHPAHSGKRRGISTAGVPTHTMPFITSDPTDAHQWRALLKSRVCVPEHKLAVEVFSSGVASYLTDHVSWRADDEREEAALWLEMDCPDVPFSFAWICDELGIEPTSARLAIRAERARRWLLHPVPRSPRPWSAEVLPRRCRLVLAYLADHPGPHHAPVIGVGIGTKAHGADWALRDLMARGRVEHRAGGYVLVGGESEFEVRERAHV